MQLLGCRTQPLSSYLKGLGVFRLVATQIDQQAELSWDGQSMVLHTSLSPEQLVQWFQDDYAPTPVTSPWNGGSGYHPKDKAPKLALEEMRKTEHPRFGPYRDTIADCRQALLDLKISDKPDPKTEKPKLIRRLRSTLKREEALQWLDAACIVGEDGLEMVPLLGTGGNDGRLEFSVNFVQYLQELLLGKPKQKQQSLRLLRQALFEEPCNGLSDGVIGQYDPGSAGGPNTTSGFDGAPNVNPWDFVLALEGTMVFAAAATRRLASNSQNFSVPFTVNPTIAGTASAVKDSEKARCEMWLPTWTQSVRYRELEMIFSEGRAQTGNRPAGNGLDFARAVAGLGVERGLDSFERYTFMVRNGKSYFASPAGRFVVRPGADAEKQRRNVDALHDIQRWLDYYRGKAEGSGGQYLVSLFRQLDSEILELCRSKESTLEPILRTLGRIQRRLGLTKKLHEKGGDKPYADPLPLLGRAWWPDLNTSAPEWRLAASFVGLERIREFLLPVEIRSERHLVWDDENRDCVWQNGSLVKNLNAVLQRRFLSQPRQGDRLLDGLRLQRWRLGSRVKSPVRAADLLAFLEDRVDEGLLEDAIFGLSLVKLEPPEVEIGRGWESLPHCYATLRCAYATEDLRSDGSGDSAKLDWLPPAQPIHLLASGRVSQGMRAAERFLVGRGLIAQLRHSENSDLSVSGERLCASLAFPVPTYLYQSKKSKPILPSRAQLKREESNSEGDPQS